MPRSRALDSVANQRLQLFGLLGNSKSHKNRVSGIQQELKRRKALLGVDDGAALDSAWLIRPLLDDDRTQKVRTMILDGVSQHTVGKSTEIGPQRPPLGLKVPDLPPLVQRDFEKLTISKHIVDVVILSLHEQPHVPHRTLVARKQGTDA